MSSFNFNIHELKINLVLFDNTVQLNIKNMSGDNLIDFITRVNTHSNIITHSNSTSNFIYQRQDSGSEIE